MSVRSLKDHPFFPTVVPWPQQAVIVGRCADSKYSFTFETGALNVELSRRCRLLKAHGSTVVELSDEGHFFGWQNERWQESMIRKAMDRVAALYPECEVKDLSAYDPEFARVVLKVAADAFPNRLFMPELKRAINPEPSDEALFTAIDALEADRYIEAKSIRGGYQNKIAAVAYILATREGRRLLEEKPEPSPMGGTVIQRQINTYGPVGAVGDHSHGAVAIHNHASTIEQIDLRVLAVHLEELRVAYKKTAESREDDRQVALIANAAEAAEKGDRHGVVGFLSKVSKPVLNKAVDIGTDLAAKTIADLIKGN
ncbi:MAG: hypothetical protein M3O02_03850 [Acidobacteriota bacterium]|nr:hypothetical protein [Acidobacteriota bacterium]